MVPDGTRKRDQMTFDRLMDAAYIALLAACGAWLFYGIAIASGIVAR